MLTGTRVFSGATIVEVLSETLKAELTWSALPQATPPAIQALLKRCLQKDCHRRLRDIARRTLLIEEAVNELATPGTTVELP